MKRVGRVNMCGSEYPYVEKTCCNFAMMRPRWLGVQNKPKARHNTATIWARNCLK